MTRSWLLVIPMRPTLTNAVHNMHYRKASADRKLWRTAGKDAAERADAACDWRENGTVSDAARLRSLAATFDSHLNRDKTYTGAQVAAMLRDGEG